MASTLSARSKEQILGGVNKLLGRARNCFPMPLEEDEIKLWWGLHFKDPEIPKAFEKIMKSGYSIYCTSNDMEAVFMRALDNVSPMKIKFRVRLLNRVPAERATAVQLGQRLQDAWPFSLERWYQLVEWMKTVAQINAEFCNAYVVSSFVIEKCNTAGQINRALPELAQYLTGDARDALREQKRASNMPYEWAAYDKDKVMKASLALTKANLFPKGEVSRSWNTCDTNWCTFKID